MLLSCNIEIVEGFIQMLIFILPPGLPSNKSLFRFPSPLGEGVRQRRTDEAERRTRGEASKLAILPFVMATTRKDITKRKLTQGDWSLLIANLLPVAGVWFLDWNPKEVFLVYCFETIIIGFFSDIHKARNLCIVFLFQAKALQKI